MSTNRPKDNDMDKGTNSSSTTHLKFFLSIHKLHQFTSLICPRSNKPIKNPVVIIATGEYCDESALYPEEKNREMDYYYRNLTLKSAIEAIAEIEKILTAPVLIKNKNLAQIKDDLETTLSDAMTLEKLTTPILISPTGISYQEETILKRKMADNNGMVTDLCNELYPETAYIRNYHLEEFMAEFPKWESRLKEEENAAKTDTPRISCTSQ